MIKVILEERGELQALELDRDSITIGRTADNAVRIQDALSSRHHCKIEKTPEGFFVEDLKSRNGTTLNGGPLTERTLLTVGDRIAVGQSIVHFGAKLEKAEKSDKSDKSDRAARPGKTSARPRSPADASAKPDAAKPDAVKPDAAKTGRKPRFALKGLEGSRTGKATGIAGFPYTIGSKKGASLCLEDEDVSPEHCMLVEDDGEVHAVDLNSESGTFVDGKRVKGRERLKAGATLGVGKARFKLKDLGVKTASDDDLEPLPGDVKAKAPNAPVVVEADFATLGEDDEDDEPARTPSAARPRPGKDAAKAPDSSRGAKVPDSSRSAKAPDSGRAGAEKDLSKPERDLPKKETTAKRGKPAGAPSAEAVELVEAGQGQDAGIATSELSAAALEQGAGGGGAGAAGLVLLLVLGLVGTAIPVARAALTRVDPDPEPAGNLVANWSFEASPALRGWTAGGDASPAKLLVSEKEAAFGKSAVRLEAGATRGELRATEAHRLDPGKDLVLHAQVRTKDQAAAVLAVEWTDDRRADWKELSFAAIADARPEWSDAGSVVHPPETATHARVVLQAVPVGPSGAGAAFFDRISLQEEEASKPLPPLVAAGLEVLATPRGELGFSRSPRAVGAPPWIARAHLAIAATDGSRGDPISSQLAWTTGTPTGDPGDGGLLADGSILDLAGGERVSSAVIVKPSGEKLRVTWEAVKKELADGRSLRVVIDVPHLKDIAPVVLAGQTGATKPLEDAFREQKASYLVLPGIVEMVWGSGAEQVSLRMLQPVNVEAERVGDGVRLELVAVPLVKGDARLTGFDMARASTLARERLRLLLEQAEAARREGRLEESRQAFLRVAQEFGHEKPVAERATRDAVALSERADRLLEAVQGAAEDNEPLGLPELAKAARTWSDLLAKAFPGGSQLARASAAVAKAEEATKRSQTRVRSGRAREIVSRALKHREAGRVRLARLLYTHVIESYPADDPAVKDAKNRLAAMPKEEE